MDKSRQSWMMSVFQVLRGDCNEQGYHMRNDEIGTDAFSMEAAN